MADVEMTWRSAVLLAACTPAVGVAVALVVRGIERRAAAFLAGFLVLACLSIAPQIIGFAGFYDRWPNLTFIPLDAELYLPGLFYLHASALVESRTPGRRYWVLLPGVLQTVYLTVIFVAFPDHLSKWAFAKAVHGPYVVPLQVLVGVVMTVLVLRWTVRALARYRVFLEATESADGMFDPAWIRQAILGVGILGAVWAGVELFGLIAAPTYVQAYPSWVVLSAAVSAFALAGLAGIRKRFPKLQEPKGVPPFFTSQLAPHVAAQLKLVTEADRRKWRAAGVALRSRFVDAQWHREPRLSIRDVAHRMATNETYVSRSLNEGLGISFQGFVNGLRIAQAKRELAATQDPILEVGLRAGFGSKATFNRVFRQRVGMTPSAFRRSQDPDSSPESGD